MGRKHKKRGFSEGASQSHRQTHGSQTMSQHTEREIMELVNCLLEKCSGPLQTGPQEWEDFLQIYELVEKLQKKQQAFVMKPYKREEHFGQFTTWLQKHNVDTSRVEIAHFEREGHGLKVTRDVEMSEIFLSIPRKIMMSTETAETSQIGLLMEVDRMLQGMPNVVLALHLLAERATPTSLWTPYIKTLPMSYTTPLYFKPQHIQLLKGSPVYSEVLNHWRNIARQYAYFYTLFHIRVRDQTRLNITVQSLLRSPISSFVSSDAGMARHPAEVDGHAGIRGNERADFISKKNSEAGKLPIKNFCFDDYRWAVSTVMTRQNHIPSVNSGKVTSALIPLWDMCNHCNGQITTDFNQETDSSECYALRNFPKDSQVFIFYGSRSNAELFLHSGFVYPSNQYDRVSLRLGVSKKDELYKEKSELLAQLSMLPSRLFYLRTQEDPVDSDLLAFLRVLIMNDRDIKEHLTGARASKLQRALRDFGESVSKENELRMWSYLETRISLLLRAYATTAEEDGLELEQCDLADNVRMVLQLRRCEKRILENLRCYVSSYISKVELWPEPEPETAEAPPYQPAGTSAAGAVTLGELEPPGGGDR